MNEKVLKYLYDIKLAIDEIDSFFLFREKRFEDYKKDILLKRAIERNLEIIGEAVTRILREEPEFPLENAKRIIGLRNQIIHGYDSVSDENIWGVIINHIPKLKQELIKLIT
ncbi:MAG: HepT-like ribonuclease domain-containing protein [Paludibacter sp.]